MRLRERIFAQWEWRLPADGGQVALTFDDGPNPKSTPALLAALSNLNVTATMFVLGSACAAHPSLVRECHAAGHTIALHGYTHESQLMWSGRRQEEDILRAIDAIETAGVRYERLFRPPYGHWNVFTAGVLRRMGLRGVLWSQIPRDWSAANEVELGRAMLRGLHPGAIVLLHDVPSTIGNVLASLPSYTYAVHARGWHFTSLSYFSSHSPARA